MEQFVSGKVMHGGTYNAQPVTMAATCATLAAPADGQIHARLELRSGSTPGIARALAEADVVARAQGFPDIFHVAPGIDTPISNYREALAADKKRYVQFTTALLKAACVRSSAGPGSYRASTATR